MRILKVNQVAEDHPGLCTDLARGGIGFETATRLELGSAIEFEFAFVGDHPFRHNARILYRIGNHYGASRWTAMIVHGMRHSRKWTNMLRKNRRINPFSAIDFNAVVQFVNHLRGGQSDVEEISATNALET
jgi:hypothetical protein